MFKTIFNKSKNLIGIDITRNSIKLLELEKQAKTKNVKIIAYANINCAKSLNEKNDNNESEILIDALKKAILEADTKTKEVAVALTHTAIINKTIALNCKLSKDELDKFVNLNAKKYIESDLDSVSYDYSLTDDKLQIIAVRKERTDKLITILKSAGLNAKVIDLNSFALERAHREKNQINCLTAIINIEVGSILICIVDQNKILYTNETFIDDTKFQTDTEIIQLIKKVLYVGNSVNKSGLEKIILCGNKASNPALINTLSAELNISVNMADPFSSIKIDNSLDEKKLAEAGAGMMICYGLALRKFTYEYN